MDQDRRAYIVCCTPRIVLFGYATDAEVALEHPILYQVRMLVYWDAATKGVHGAAAHGPTAACRVTPAVEMQTVDTRVEARLLCSEASIERFEKGPWA